jgi:hypothetical protein
MSEAVEMLSSTPGKRVVRDGWEADEWTVVLGCEGRTMELRFYMGTGHGGVAPELADVLDCIALDAATVDQTDGFEEWASEIGADPGSRKAEADYRATVEQTDGFRVLAGGHFDALVYADR